MTYKTTQFQYHSKGFNLSHTKFQNRNIDCNRARRDISGYIKYLLLHKLVVNYNSMCFFVHFASNYYYSTFEQRIFTVTMNEMYQNVKKIRINANHTSKSYEHK